MFFGPSFLQDTFQWSFILNIHAWVAILGWYSCSKKPIIAIMFWRPNHSLSKSGYFYFGHSRTHFWSQGPKILAVTSVLANLWNIKRVFENFDFWPLFDRYFISRVSRGRQVTFDKLPVGPKPKEKLPFFFLDFFFGLKKIKVTEQPAKKSRKN